MHTGRLEQARLLPWKGSEQFLSLEASFRIPLHIYLVTLPKLRGIQGTASLYCWSCVSVCRKSQTSTMATEAVSLALAGRLHGSGDPFALLRQFLTGPQDSICRLLLSLCCLWLHDLNKYLTKKATQLFVFRFLVRVSYLEIYNEEVRDLLGKDQTQRLEVSCLFWIRWYCSLLWNKYFKDQRAFEGKWEAGFLGTCPVSSEMQ